MKRSRHGVLAELPSKLQSNRETYPQMIVRCPNASVNHLSEADARRLLVTCPDNEFVATLQEVLKRFRCDGWLSIDQAAKLADTSVRSFQRRLAEQGESFSRLSDTTRAERANGLLKCTDRSLAEIASELGYTEPANFARAFKRWAGEAPKQFRDRSSTRSDEADLASSDRERDAK